MQKKRLMDNYESLNPFGRDKLVEYSDDLTEVEKYTQTEAVHNAKEA